jgi:hypothetical protein
MALTFELGINSATAIQLYPEYDFKDATKIIESKHRTPTGRQYNYKWGNYERFEFSLNYVAEANASVVNSWWDSRTELLFFITSDTNTDVYSVMIMNKDNPLLGFNKPYDVYRKGKLILESY